MLNHIIYKYNDMSFIFYQYISGTFRISQLGPVDYLSHISTRYFVEHFGVILGLNILGFSFIILSIIFCYSLFLSHLKSRIISIFFSIIYSLSIYYTYRLTSLTPSLYIVFIFPLTIYLLKKRIKPIYLGTINLFFLCLSSYYAFFSAILIGLWYLYDKKFKYILIFSLPLILGILLVFLPILKQNTYLGTYEKGTSQTVYRPIEDWYNLSFRPWYFFIPPKTSLFFGDLSNNIHNKISSTGYYLTQNYMEEEMAGSYMGWHFLLGMAFVATLLLLQKYKHKEYLVFKSVYENKEMIFRSFFIIFCILLISGPPSITIKGLEIYTPTYLLYYIVPVFRTLVRWAVVIYLFVLIINAYLVQDLYNLLKKPWQKVAFLLGFLGLNFVIFAVKIPVINVKEPPHEIAFVKKAFPDTVKYAVYPKGDYYSIFWIISHEDFLINPQDYVDAETGFDSKVFSENLLSPEGVEDLIDRGASYLIFYSDKVDVLVLQEEFEWVENVDSLVEFFEENFGEVIYEEKGIRVFERR